MKKHSRKLSSGMIASMSVLLLGMLFTIVSVSIKKEMNPGQEIALEEEIPQDIPEKEVETVEAKIEPIPKTITESITIPTQEPTEEPIKEPETEPEEGYIEEPPVNKVVETTAKPVEAPSLTFSDSHKIGWPLEGNVIMDYSMDSSIYYPTMKYYKYHPAIVISAETGTPVQAGAPGRIEKIWNDEETGLTMKIDLGSGYYAVYGQLQEPLLKEQDLVEKGDILGYVNEPTKYYTVEGSNLHFAMEKEEEPIDPLDYLE